MPECLVSVHQFGQQTAAKHIDELSGSAQCLLCAEDFGEQWIEIGLAVAAKKTDKRHTTDMFSAYSGTDKRQS